MQPANLLSRIFSRLTERPLQTIRLMIVGTTFPALAIAWYDTLSGMQANERDAVERIRVQALIQARAAGETVQASIERFDFALKTARLAALESPEAMDRQGQLAIGAMPADLVLQQFRIDADGYLGYSSLGPAPRNYLGDRDYFRELAADTGDTLVITPPVLGRLTHKWSIQIARAVRRNGRFEGVMSIAVSPEAWTAQLSRFDSGPHDTLTLLTGKGQVLLRTLNPGANFGKQAPLQREYITHPNLREGHYVAHASVDGILRLYGWTRLSSGLVMMSGIALDDALAPIRKQNAWTLQRAAASSLILALLIAGLLVALKRYEGAVGQLAEREAHLRKILDNMAEGIVIIDSDNCIVGANPAFSLITGYGEDELRGRPVSTLPAGHPGELSLGELLGPPEARHKQGDFEGLRRNGEPYTGHAEISAVLDSNGQVAHRVVLISDVTERRRQEGAIWHQANFDRLTGLPNRGLINDRLDNMLHHAKRHRGEVVVLFIDLDRFKPVNDTYGHDVGDLLLQQVAARLLKLFRDEDTVARLGGDEFVVAMPSPAGASAVEPAAAKVVDSLAQPFEVAGHVLKIGSSVGVARFPADGDSAEQLINAADHAMYRAKNAGRGRWST